jgi:alkaline phosphatase D
MNYFPHIIKKLILNNQIPNMAHQKMLLRYFSGLVICSLNVLFAQKSTDSDETVYQLKKALSVHLGTSENTSLNAEFIHPTDEKESLRHGQKNEKIAICGAPFLHSVASGDPLSDRVIIWTRWTPPMNFSEAKSIIYQVSQSLDFSQIEQENTVLTDSSKDYTVKIDLTNLQPSTYYYYRFIADTDTSVIGRTKTASVGNVDNVRLAFVNCNDYRRGYFNAYKTLADKNDMDAVVHLGDYIYETGGGPENRRHEPNAEVWRLQDYRTRYSQYKLDSNLARCHQVYPFIQIWDDHDIVVDAVTDTSLRHDAEFGSYQVRKNVAVQAFREWNPVREVSDTNTVKNWRKFSYGNMLDLFMLDVRLYDRSVFAVDVNDTIYNSPYAKMCGPEQLEWLKEGLHTSTAKWKIIANGLMFGQLQVASVPLVFENWDGYNFERNQILNLIDTANIKNVIVYSGDFHCSFATNLAKNPFNFQGYNPLNGNGSLAVEFIPPSLSSDNFDEGNDFGLGAGNAGLAQSLITTSNPHIRYCDLNRHGYALLDLRNERAQNEFWFLQNIQDPYNMNESAGSIWRVLNNEGKLTSGGTVSNPLSPAPPAPLACLDPFANLSESPLMVTHLFPNPFHDWIKVAFVSNNGEPVHFAITDLTSKKTWWKKTVNFDIGQNMYWIPTAELASGAYLFTIQQGNLKQVKKVVKI